MANIDNLNIEITANATKANHALDKLAGNITKLSSAMSAAGGANMSGLVTSLQGLTQAMTAFNSSAIKTQDFTRIAKNLNQLADVNTAGLQNTANAILEMNTAIISTSRMRENFDGFISLSQAIGTLGSAKVEKAIANIPLLAREIVNLLTTLNKAPAVRSEITRLVEALAKLTSQGAKVGTTSRSLVSHFNSVSRSAKSTKKSISSLAATFGMFYANCWLAIRGLQMLGKAISSSMGYIENLNYFDAAFRQIAESVDTKDFEKLGYDSAEAYVGSFKKRTEEITKKMTGWSIADSGELVKATSGLGLNPTELMQYQAQFAQISNSMGMTADAATKVSSALTRLGADLASVKNLNFNEVWGNLTSGLVGMSRTVDKYGVNIRNANLQEKLMELGIDANIQKLGQNDKALLRTIVLLESTKYAWGDLGNTINQPANALRVFNANIKMLGQMLGNLFIPMISAVLPYINALVKALQELVIWLGKVMGIKITYNRNNGGGGVSDLTSDVLDANDALEDATESAKKLKQTVLGIDELNINDPNSGSGTNATTNVGGVSSELNNALDDIMMEYDSIWEKALNQSNLMLDEWVNKVKTWFKAAWDAIEPFRNALSKLWDVMKLIGDFAWQGLKDFYNEFLVPLAKWAFGTEDEGFTKLVNIITNDLNRIPWEEINKNLKDFWKAIEPYAEEFGKGLIDFLGDVSKVTTDVFIYLFGDGGPLTKLTDWLNKNDPTRARDWGYALGQVVVGLLLFKLVKGVSTTISAIAISLGALKKALDAFGFSAFAKKIGTGIEALTIALTSSELWVALGNLISFNPAMVGMVGMTFEDWLTENVPWLDTNNWKGIPAIIDKIILDILASVGKGMENIALAMADAVNNAMSYIKDGIKKFISAFTDYGKSDGGILKHELEFGKNILLGIMEGFVGAISLITDPIMAFFNGLVQEICNVFGIHSPAKEMEPFGEYIFLGIMSGFESLFSTFTDSVNTFWTEYVTPWFTSDKWGETFAGMTTAISVAINNFVTVWKTGITTWWNSHVSPWFTFKRWSDLLAPLKSAFGTGFKAAANEAIAMMNKVIEGVEWMVNKAISALNKLIEAAKKAASLVGKSFSMSKIDDVSLPRIPQFKNGGFPEDGWFRASQGEIMGTFDNGKSVVANNQQIIEGIKSGVAEANVETNNLLRIIAQGLSNGSNVVVEIDGRELVTAYNERSARNGFSFT